MGTRHHGDAGRRATIRDVAARAGVSTATVSRALDRPQAVRPALRDRVAEAVAALAYVPDQAARSLASRHSRLVAVLAPDLDDAGRNACIAALQQRLAAAGYATLVELTGGDARREAAAAVALAGRGVEAVVAVGRMPAASVRDDLAHLGLALVPVACGDREAEAAGGADPATPVGAWTIDVRGAGAIVAGFLGELGHRRFGWVAAEDAAGAAAALRAGLAGALAAAGRPPAVTIVPTAAGAVPDLRALLAGPDPAPTALVCASDALALAAVRALADAGIAVPGQVSVVGCGDLPCARHARPPLTTLRLPQAAIGTAAAEALLARLAAAGASIAGGTLLAKLVVRRSTGPAPAACGPDGFT